MARMFVVGDINQSIYRFRGADSRAFDRIEEMLRQNGRSLSIKELPINYRSDKAIIEYAQRIVPGLQGFSKAQGIVDVTTFGEAITRCNNNNQDIPLNDGVNGARRELTNCTFAFLCRINLPLVVTAYQLIAAGKKCCIIGRNQIGGPLKNIIYDLCGKNDRFPKYTNLLTNRYDNNNVLVEEGLMSRLANYVRLQTAKLEEDKYKEKLEQLHQNVECIEVIASRVSDDKVSSVIDEIDNLFTEDADPGSIVLSTVHRAKGLEFDVVFILRPDLIPHPRAVSEDEIQQEKNLEYVAITRAKKRLYLVENWPFGNTKNVGTLNFDRPGEVGRANYDDMDADEHEEWLKNKKEFERLQKEYHEELKHEKIDWPKDKKPFEDDGLPF